MKAIFLVLTFLCAGSLAQEPVSRAEIEKIVYPVRVYQLVGMYASRNEQETITRVGYEEYLRFFDDGKIGFFKEFINQNPSSQQYVDARTKGTYQITDDGLFIKFRVWHPQSGGRTEKQKLVRAEGDFIYFEGEKVGFKYQKIH